MSIILPKLPPTPRNRAFMFHRANLSSSAIGAMATDAAESVFLAGELEYIDKTVYMQPYAELKAMQFIPSKSDIPQWAQTHTWRETDGTGRARILNASGQDFPRSDITRREVTKSIREMGDSYGYSWSEMQAAASVPDIHLDADRAIFCRYSLENLRDRILCYGDAANGLEGLFNLTGVNAFVLGDKAKGGKTWGTLTAPNATGKEVAYDLMGMASDIINNAKGFISQVSLVLPIDAYNYAAQKEWSATDSRNALQVALGSPFIASIDPWYRCSAANSDGLLGADTIVAYPRNPMFLAGINPMEYTTFPADQIGLEWIVKAMMKTGGTCVRYPYLMRKATGF